MIFQLAFWLSRVTLCVGHELPDWTVMIHKHTRTIIRSRCVVTDGVVNMTAQQSVFFVHRPSPRMDASPTQLLDDAAQELTTKRIDIFGKNVQLFKF